MNKSKKGFKAADIFLLVMAVLPIVLAITLKVLFTPAEEGISITGALIYFTVPLPRWDLPITESQVNSWCVMASIAFLCLFLTHGISERPAYKRQHIAELIVEFCDNMVKGNMGEYFAGFAPFVCAILGLSAFSSLSALFGLFAPTSDMNVVAGWALLTFFLITYYKMKCGPVQYLKSFGQPVKFLAPLNIISEFATPVSMAFRHYGNVLSGSVISVLIAALLQTVSHAILGRLPGIISEIPVFQIGLPAVLSIYFDVFSGILQAYIFAMLTMLYVSGAFPLEEYMRRKTKKANKQLTK